MELIRHKPIYFKSIYTKKTNTDDKKLELLTDLHERKQLDTQIYLDLTSVLNLKKKQKMIMIGDLLK